MSQRARRPGTLPPGLAGRLDPVCDRFESQWRAGARPRLEDFLGLLEERDRPALRGQSSGLRDPAMRCRVACRCRAVRPARSRAAAVSVVRAGQRLEQDKGMDGAGARLLEQESGPRQRPA